MFTGIVQGLGTVLGRREAGGGAALTIAPAFLLEDPQEGESIAVNGVCLTARHMTERCFEADVSPETLKYSNLGGLRAGARVNLERALRLSDRLGGHLVSGHIDGVSRVVGRQSKGNFTLFTFSLAPRLSPYVVAKGSVAVSGVSLTVTSRAEHSFSAAIIPHTLAETILGLLAVGDTVNIEVDLIGKYVESFLTKRSSDAGIDAAFLATHGFF